ncbi:MAG: hydrogenase maturation protease [Candidatus Eisenbacteria bacterium]|nr:hydrogenase maturation protease [Candidatus Eisenbacteria bacterium]
MTWPAMDGAPGEHPAPRVVVVGLGNVLMGDDAFGPYVARVLQARYEFPPEVSVQDLGTPGWDLTPHIAGAEWLVFIDTVGSTSPAGTVKRYRRDEILKNPPPPRVSPHDPGLKETLLTLEFAGRAPREVLLVGVVPVDTEMRVGLREPVMAAVDTVVADVIAELEAAGYPARPRAVPQEPDLWWEVTP